MSNTQKKLKDPNAVVDFFIDWTDWLATGETISTSTWTAESGITVDTSSNSTVKATVWLSGGTAGTEYTLTNRIVTNAGRTDERRLFITVTER